MTVSDTIGDFITRIRNSYITGNKSSLVPFSKRNKSFLTLMKSEGFIKDFDFRDDGKFGYFYISLRYKGGQPALREVKRVSRPGRRVYSKIKKLKKIYGGIGVYFLSTSKGIMTDHDARSSNLGGEVLFSVF